MGHIRLPHFRRTRKWCDVVELIQGGAGVAQIATATINAAEHGLAFAGQHIGVVEAVWILMQLPVAARQDSFADALTDCGLSVSDSPTLMEIVGAVSDAIDARMPNCKGRTDLGEMAQTAAVETITNLIGPRTKSIFGTSSEEVQHEFAHLATVKQFGTYARDFFARFTNKCLGYFLDRVLSNHTGEGRRFTTLAQQAAFSDAMETHCKEASLIVEKYSGEWFSKHNWESGGEISRQDVQNYASYAMTKLISELRKGAGLDAQ